MISLEAIRRRVPETELIDYELSQAQQDRAVLLALLDEAVAEANETILKWEESRAAVQSLLDEANQEIARWIRTAETTADQLYEAVELLSLTLLEGKENVYPYERVREFLVRLGRDQ